MELFVNRSHDEALTPKRIEKIFKKEIEPRFFADVVAPSGTPRAVFIGGQPGAGKSARERMIVAELEQDEPMTAIEINGDDYRGFHPRYYSLLQQDDATAASRIDQENAQFINLAIDKSLEVGCHAVIEGTFRRDAVVAETARRYRERGYETQAVLLVVNPLLSRLGILQRYIAQKRLSPYARFTERRSHDVSVQGIPATLERLVRDGAVDRITLVERSNATLHDVVTSTIDDSNRDQAVEAALEVIRQRFTRLTQAEQAFASEQIEAIAQKLANIEVPMSVLDEVHALMGDIASSQVVDEHDYARE